MLSRIAESLFWLGRYAERAEDTARILDVHYHLLLEDGWLDETAACEALLEAMGSPWQAVDDCDSSAVTRLLAFDDRSPASIVRSLEAAWENARGAREAISSEMWECLNAAHESLPGEMARAGGQAPPRFFGWVKERAAMLAGLSDSTLSRDDGWRFLLLGRSLERVDMTARLLSTRFCESWSTGEWITTLRCCSAYEAYLRTYQRAVDGPAAAEFLVLDRLFPRSIYHALRTAEESLAALDDPRTGRLGVDDPARRHLGSARARLEFTPVDEVLADLPLRLAQVQDRCFEASTALAWRWFRPAGILEWSA